MKKFKLLLCGLLLLFTGCEVGKKEESITKYDNKDLFMDFTQGKVEKGLNYKKALVYIEGDIEEVFTKEYSEDGKLLKEKTAMTDSDVFSKILFAEYNEECKNTGIYSLDMILRIVNDEYDIVSIEYDYEDDLLKKMDMNYDGEHYKLKLYYDNGLKEKMTFAYSGETKSNVKYYYEKGKLISVKNDDDDDDAITIKYSDDDRKITIFSTSDDDVEYVFDENNKIESISTEDISQKYIYNDDGTLKKIIRLGDSYDLDYETCRIRYNEDGKIKEIEFDNWNEISNIAYSYNSNGDLESMLAIDDYKDEVVRIEFMY